MSQNGVDTEKDITQKKGVRVCVHMCSILCMLLSNYIVNMTTSTNLGKKQVTPPVIIEGMKDRHPLSYEDKSWWHIQEAFNYVQHGSTILPHEVSIHAM